LGINFDFRDIKGMIASNLQVVICLIVVFVCLAVRKSLEIWPREIGTSRG